MTQPGNARAAAFSSTPISRSATRRNTSRSSTAFPNGATGPTANVIATLRGTENPDSSTSSAATSIRRSSAPAPTTTLRGRRRCSKPARLLAGRPQPATIVFASFTGEEGGLFGSREFVRRAVADKLRIVGALNNDMVGWANDERLDDTIRYSNAGIRDLQHAAAIQFSNLITYDAHYYKNTDAAAYYEAYGDIVGGIGSYPCSAARTTISRTTCSKPSTTSSSPRSPGPPSRA